MNDYGRLVGYIGDLIDPFAAPTQPFYIGGRILSLSRIHMSRALQSIGGYKIPTRSFLYTDTDSLLLRAEAVLSMEASTLGDSLGQFKDDIKGGGNIIAAVLLAPKMYALVYQVPSGKLFQKIRAKGISHTSEAIEVFSLEDRAVHDPELEKKVKELDLWREGGRSMPSISPKFRAYVAEYLDGSTVTIPYLSYSMMKGMVMRTLKSLRAYAGSFKIHYATSNWGGSGLSITPTVVVRGIAETSWWDKGKRIFMENIDFTVPVGFKLTS
jgi:hypothetical protein